MNSIIKKLIYTSISIIFFGGIIIACKTKSENVFQFSDFKNPPENSKIYAWWHWVDKAISREGITRDLEAMKKQGITGVTILNIGILPNDDFGIPKVTFASPEWFDMFKWALHEANRLGITVGAHNCDGWSTSGGPWITPDMSMKEFTWSETFVNGGRLIDTTLAQPVGNLNYYKDVEVIAYPAVKRPNSFQMAKPFIKIDNQQNGRILMDGNPLTQVLIDKAISINFTFDEPFEADKFAIHLRVPTSWNAVNDLKTVLYVKASVDGINFWTVQSYEIIGVNKTIEKSLPRTKVRYFKIEITRSGDLPDYSKEGISEFEFLKKDEAPYYNATISNHLEKIVSTRFDDIKEIFTAGTNEQKADSINPERVIFLTDSIASDGHIHWQAPAGMWTILRFGYTTTGAQNAPATDEGRGLECDKMDTNALNLHFKNFPEKLIQEAGRYKGNTFKFLFIDSWECGFQNWTKDFTSEFESRNGYSLLPWIPALCGNVVKNSDETEAFLNDFRKTIADLISERYYKHFADLCHREGIQLHAEVIYGGSVYPPLNILKTNNFIDVPMYEFWASQDRASGLVKYQPSDRTDFDKPAMAAEDYDKPILASEAYTGYAHYSESPWDLKLFGDRGYCSGINRMVLHSYVHQPFEKIPGMTLGVFGSHFNRHNSWWSQASGWFTYQARIQSVLQKGQVVADALFFTGDRLPEYGNYNEFYSLPAGFNSIECNLDLLKQAIVKNNEIVMPDGHTFRLLIIPNDSAMELSTIYKIGSLIHQGCSLYGPRPLKTLGLKNYLENNNKLFKEASKIWGDIDGKTVTVNNYGKGIVFWGIPLPEVIDQLKMVPDFATGKKSAVNLLFIHKKADNEDVYFVVNQEDKEVTRDLVFRIDGKTPEIWDPMYGTQYKPAIYAEENGRLHIPVKFTAKQTLLFIFRNQQYPDHIINVLKDGHEIYKPESGSDPEIAFPSVYFLNDSIMFNPDVKGEYLFSSSSGETIKILADNKTKVRIDKLEGKITFLNNAYMEHEKEVEISKPEPWNYFNDPDIRYFSGTANYNLNFTISNQFTSHNDSILLSLGDLKETAYVELNDSSIGYVWSPDFLFNVKGLLKDGNNTLKIYVSNVYRNRILGDLVQYGKVENLWTTSPIDQLLTKYMPLKESGVMGPIEIYKISSVRLKPDK